MKQMKINWTGRLIVSDGFLLADAGRSSVLTVILKANHNKQTQTNHCDHGRGNGLTCTWQTFPPCVHV